MAEKEKKINPAYVTHGHSVVVRTGIAHAGAKLTWPQMEGPSNAAKQRVFQELIKKGHLEKILTAGEIRAATAAGQLGFETDGEAPGDEAPDEAPDEVSEEVPDEAPEEVPEEIPKTSGSKPKFPTRRSGAKRK